MARVVNYGVVDDYGSVWMPDVFDQSLEERMPTLAWAHSWSEPIGRGIAWRANGDLREIDFRLDDFDAVPHARRAFAQVQSGTIDDCSVGFSNTDRHEPSDDDLAWCAEHYPQLDPWQVAREFRTYWQGCGKPMADWSMTFRNRVQKVAGWSKQTGPTRTFL